MKKAAFFLAAIAILGAFAIPAQAQDWLKVPGRNSTTTCRIQARQLTSLWSLYPPEASRWGVQLVIQMSNQYIQ